MPSKTLRVLQVLPSLESGGVEKNTLDLLKFSHDERYNVEFHVASSGGVLVQDVLDSGALHHTLPLKKRDPLSIIKNARALKNIIKENQINVVHARSRGPAWSAFWAAKQCCVPFITTYHGTYNGQNWAKRFYNSVMARGDRVIAISSFMKAHIFEQHKSCNPIVEEIYEGIDTKLFDPAVHQDFQIKEFRKKFDVKESQKLLLLVGRLTRWKGQEILLKALKDLNKADYVVMLIGDDQGRLNYKKELGDLANSLNISVHFVESFSPLSLAYAAADIVFSCSTDPEAFGRVTAEALCMGKPFIGTNCGATTELTQHGVFAELVEPGDPSQLKEAIQKILNMSQQELDKKALEARKHIMSEYSLPRMCTQTLQLYERVKGSA